MLDRSSTSEHILVGCWAFRLDKIISLGGATTSQQLLQHLPHVLFLRNHQVPFFTSAITLGLQFKSCSNSAPRGRNMDMNNQWYKKKKKLWHRTEKWWTLQRNHQCIMTENCKWLVSTVLSNYCLNLTFIGPCIVTYSCSTTNKMHLFLKLLILVKRPTRFGRSFRPSSGAQNYTYGNRHKSNSCSYLLLAERPFETRREFYKNK